MIDLTNVRGHEYFETWNLNKSGLFYNRALMDEETYPKAIEQGKVLGYELTVYNISEAIGSLWHLYRELGVPDNEVITVNFKFLGVKDRNLVVLRPSRV